MNPFDDLVPGSKPDGANPFDDLVPKTTAGGLARTAAASGIDNVGALMQGGGEIIAKLANSATGTQDFRATNPLKFATDYIKDGMSQGDKLAAQDSFKGDVLKPETWELPNTIGGAGHAIAQGLGSVGPTILTALAARGRPIPAMAAQGGLMTGGAAAGDIRENFDKLDTDEKLAAASPAFAQLVAGGMSPAEARAKVTNESAQYGGLISGLAGAAGGAVNAKLLEGVIAKKGIPALLGTALAERGIARTATGAAVGGIGEGFQEGLEKVGQNAGENLGLGKSIGDDVTRDTFGDVVGGALVGKITGGVGGALSKPGVVAPDGAVINPDAGPISRAAATAINTGAAQGKADQKTAETVAQQDQAQQAEAQQQQDAAAKAFTGKPQFDDPLKWWEALNGAGQTALVQKLDGEERQTALELMATARDPRTSDPIREKAAGMLYGIAQNIGLPGTVAPVSPLALPAPQKDNNQQGRDNIAEWSKQSPALTLQDAQLMQATAVKDGRNDMVIVPHGSGQGYTMVPQAWVGNTDITKESGALQGVGGRLPSPDTPRDGTMIAGKDGVRQQTYGDLDTTAQRAVSEASATLGDRKPQPAQVIRNAEPTSDVSTKVKPGAVEGEYIRGRQTAEQYFPFKNAQQAEARAMAATKEFGEEYGVEPHPSVKGAFAVVPASKATSNQTKQAKPVGDTAMPASPNASRNFTERTPFLQQLDRLINVPANGAQPNNGNLTGAKSPVNGSVTSANGGRNVLSSDALLSKGYSSLDVPSQSRVLKAVTSLIHDDKVFSAVVHSVPVDVMNQLAGSESAAKQAFSDKAVFIHALTANSDLAVRSSAIDALVSGAALPVAKGLAPNQPRGRLEGNGGAVQASGSDGHEGAFSLLNNRQLPSDAQVKAGNYKLGHTRINGLDISIENPPGSVRKGIGSDGTPWTTKMQAAYGYIKRTTGADKDQVDVFIKGGTAPDHSGDVYVVDQVNPKTGSFDEHKAMIGFKNQMAAAAAYRAHYAKDWKGMGAITPMPINEFKTWVKSPEAAKPLALENKPNDGIPQPVAPTVRDERAPSDSAAAPDKPTGAPTRKARSVIGANKRAGLAATDVADSAKSVADAGQSQSDGAGVALSRAEYDAKANALFDAGEKAKAAIVVPDATAAKFKLKMLDGRISAAEQKYSKGFGIEDGRKAIDKLKAERPALAALVQESQDAQRARWNADQDAMVAHAETHLQDWIDRGIIKFYPKREGETRLTLQSYRDAVKAKPSAEPVATSPEIVALRTRASVLKSLKACLG